MDKFLEYLFTKAKILNIFLTIFITCMIIGGTIVYPMYQHYSTLIALACFSAIIGGMFASIIGLSRSAQAFYDQADELETFVREDGDKDKAIEMLYALKDKSFHRQTGSRIREIAKMMEIKYKLEILKR